MLAEEYRESQQRGHYEHLMADDEIEEFLFHGIL